MPATVLIVNSTSTVSVGKLAHMDPKMKSHTGLISLAIFLKKIRFYCFCLEVSWYSLEQNIWL